MVVTVKAGDANWAIAISTAKTGAIGSETPDGDVYFFMAKGISVNAKPLDPFEPASSFVSRYPTNKRAITVRMTKCHIPPEIAATSTEELDLILDFVYHSSIKTGANKVFLFIKHVADTKYRHLSWDSNDNFLQYLEGQFADYTDKLTGDNYVWILDFVFKEATIP